MVIVQALSSDNAYNKQCMIMHDIIVQLDFVLLHQYSLNEMIKNLCVSKKFYSHSTSLASSILPVGIGHWYMIM